MKTTQLILLTISLLFIGCAQTKRTGTVVSTKSDSNHTTRSCEIRNEKPNHLVRNDNIKSKLTVDELYLFPDKDLHNSKYSI